MSTYNDIFNYDEFQVSIFYSLTMLVGTAPGNTIFLGTYIVLEDF